MTNGNGTQHANWDEQRERLSAYLDGELDDTERKLLEAHLIECPACQLALVELRQVRKLLRAMPPPALPRSFALPVDQPAAAHSVSSMRAAPAPIPARAASRTPRRESRLARAAQWTGGLAASVGLFLILGAALAGGGVGHPSGAASGAQAPRAASSQNSSSGSSGSSGTTGSGVATHPPQAGVQDNATKSPYPASSAAPSTSPAASPAHPNDTGTATFGPASSPTSGSSSPTRQAPFGSETTPTPPATIVGLAGAGLAGGGALIFVGGTIGRRRNRRNRRNRQR